MHHYAVTPKRHGTRHGRWTAQAEQLLDLLNALGSTIFRQFLWQRAAELDLSYAQGQVLFHVALRIAEVELGGTLPEELAEDRAAKSVEEIEELLGLRRPAPVPSPVSLRGHSVMVHSLNS